MPSALIPFCSFGDNVGEFKRKDINLPVCTMFQPIIFDGQQCYQIKDDLYTGQGIDHGLAIVVDTNVERSGHLNTEKNFFVKVEKHMIDFFNKNNNKFENDWTFHIDTLSSYFGSTPGIYVMTDVKNISVTDNFLNLPSNKKKCMDDAYDECKTRSLLRKGLQYFNCTPFHLSLAAKTKLVGF